MIKVNIHKTFNNKFLKSAILLLFAFAFLFFVLFYLATKDLNLVVIFYSYFSFTAFIMSLLLVSLKEKLFATKFLAVLVFFVTCVGLYAFSIPANVLSSYSPPYKTFYLIDEVTKTGHLNYTMHHYEFYPAFILLGAIMKLTAPQLVDDALFLKILPATIYVISLTLVFNYKFNRKINDAIIPVFLFILLMFNPYMPLRVTQSSPPFFATILLLYFVIMLYKLPVISILKQQRHAVVLTLLLSTLVTANITISVIVLIFLFFHVILVHIASRSLRTKISDNNPFHRRLIRMVCLYYLVFFALWYMIYHFDFTGNILVKITDSLELIFNDVAFETSYFAPTYTKPFGIVLIEYAAFGMFALYYIKSFLDRRISLNLKLIALSGLISSIVFGSYWVLGAPEATDLLQRSLLMVYVTSAPMLAHHIYESIYRKNGKHSNVFYLFVKRILVIIFLTLTLLNAIFYSLPPDSYDFSIPPSKESTRFNLYEWIIIGDFLELHSNIKHYWGVRLAGNLVASRKNFVIKEYERPVYKGRSPFVIYPEQMYNLRVVTPGEYHILRRSMKIVSEWTGVDALKDFDTIISQYDIIYASNDVLLLRT
ncbi:MAG: hypothetical protein QXL77_08125 [Candidatus Bathyarchaeia archaeon]